MVINNKKYINALKSIDKEKRKTREHYLSEYVETPFEQMHFQAALIRLILFLYIHNLKIHNWKNAQNCQAYVEENDCPYHRDNYYDSILYCLLLFSYFTT